MIKEMRKNEKGFTLVELVVVIAILAILALLLVPRVLGNLEDAKRSRQLADARTIASEVVTQNALHRVDDSKPSIPDPLAATDPLLDSHLAAIGRETADTLSKMNAVFHIKVDSQGNATVYDSGTGLPVTE